MATDTTCPVESQLSGYAHSALSREATTRIEGHLSECPSCLSRFFEIEDSVGGGVRPDIPDCRLVEEIGRGRFGVVYKAWWTKGPPRVVALKLLARPSDMEKSRFEREISVLKKLDSPSIVKCLDSGTTGDSVYYMMEFVEGGHLDQYLARRTHSLDEKLRVLARVCRAVAEAHAHGVVHRDLKPRNIMIDADGRPHILDFGICAVETTDWSSWTRGTITQRGDLIGTLRYMSPEQAWGGIAGPIDERSDIWALGIMLYETVTEGAYPYSLEPTADKSAHEALLERIRKELPRLPKLRSVPRGRDLEVLLSRCLAWEPERRIQSAAALADDLERCADRRRIRTRPLGIPYRVKRIAVGAATRSRWTFSALFIACMGICLWAATWLFDVGWRAAGHQYQNGGGALAWAADPHDARDEVLIVGVTDETPADVTRYAEEKSIEGVTGTVPTWRAVHGRLMTRLADVRPRAVVWDYYFRTRRPGDRALIAGAKRLEGAGVPVVFAALTFSDEAEPDLSPTLTSAFGRRLRVGAILARDMVDRPGEFVTALKRDEGVVVPSVALTTLAAMLHPGARLDLEWEGRGRLLELLYALHSEGYLRERDRIEFTKVFALRQAEGAAREGDLLGCNTFDLSRPEDWKQRTVAYERLLRCPMGELEKIAGGKLVVIGDFRTASFGFRPDRHRVRYGTSTVEDVPGCYLLADAIVGLLGRRYYKAAFPLSSTTFGVMLCLAAMGCLIPIRVAAIRIFERPLFRMTLWTAVLVVATTCWVAMVGMDTFAAVHLGMAGFALVVPMAGSFWVEFARNRHRLADRQRRALHSFGLSRGGTVTLPSKRTRSLRERG